MAHKGRTPPIARLPANDPCLARPRLAWLSIVTVLQASPGDRPTMTREEHIDCRCDAGSDRHRQAAERSTDWGTGSRPPASPYGDQYKSRAWSLSGQ